MTDMNTVAMVGRLTKDVEPKVTQEGKVWGTFTLAVNRRVKSGDTWEDRGDFFEVKSSGPGFKGISPYLKKGRQIGIAGYLVQERWTDANGRNCEKVKIYASNIQLLSDPNQSPKLAPAKPATQPAPKGNGPESFESSDFDDLPDF